MRAHARACFPRAKSGSLLAVHRRAALWDESKIMSGDHVRQLETWTSGMVPSGGRWRLCYQKSRDGASGSTFHSKCDRYTKTIVVLKNNYDKIIGGTNVGSWSSTYSGGSSVRQCHCTSPTTATIACRAANESQVARALAANNQVGTSPYQMMFSLTHMEKIMKRTTSYDAINHCGSSYGPIVRRHPRDMTLHRPVRGCPCRCP